MKLRVEQWKHKNVFVLYQLFLPYKCWAPWLGDTSSVNFAFPFKFGDSWHKLLWHGYDIVNKWLTIAVSPRDFVSQRTDTIKRAKGVSTGCVSLAIVGIDFNVAFVDILPKQSTQTSAQDCNTKSKLGLWAWCSSIENDTQCPSLEVGVGT